MNASDHESPADRSACHVSPSGVDDCVSLAHGEGGRLMRRLIQDHIVAPLRNELLTPLGDAAHLTDVGSDIAVTTDSYVVSPLFFPGGDIGSLSVFGTANDLLVSGARPLYLTLSMILEEGLPLVDLDRVIASIAKASMETGIRVVCGDTKVVPRRAADGMFLTTTGVGKPIAPVPPGPDHLREGDVLIVSGPIGCHGIAVMCAREGLMLEPPPKSDSRSLASMIDALRDKVGGRVRAMRDATRGGVAAVLHEWARDGDCTLSIDESDLPVTPDVRGACELLGLDPVHIANEGTMLIAVEADAADAALEALRSLPESFLAAKIGKVVAKASTPVTITRMLGRPQPVDEPQGAPLPRIC